jgi:hypothetical protein
MELNDKKELVKKGYRNVHPQRKSGKRYLSERITCIRINIKKGGE